MKMTDRKIEEYNFVVEYTRKDFEEAVIALIAYGFQLHGNAGVATWPNGTGIIFSQAMVLYAVEEDV
jgi:hypothetical protein